MAVKIRLARGGAKKKAFYQVVVADERFPRDGRFIEKLGQYDPKQNPPMFNVVEERTLEWLNKGAQPTDTVRQLLRKQGIWAKASLSSSRRLASKRCRWRSGSPGRGPAPGG